MKTTWLANKWIWSAVVVALFAVGCGEGAPVTENCTYKAYLSDGTLGNSARMNCEVSGNVLTLYYGGRIVLTIDKDNQEMRFYTDGNPDDPEPGTVTVSADKKTWKFVHTNYKTSNEITLD